MPDIKTRRAARRWQERKRVSTGYEQPDSVSFNHGSGEICIAANPRMTRAVFRGQHVKVSLFERNELESEVAKLLHCWFCSNIRLGRALGNGNGAHLDTLAPHVWGHAAWEGFSASDRSKKRGELRAALDEIADRTRGVQGGMGCTVGKTNSGLVGVSRPKELPFLEGQRDMRPSDSAGHLGGFRGKTPRRSSSD